MGQAGQLLPEVRGQGGAQLVHRGLVDLAEPRPAGLVEVRLAHLLQELLDHRPDAQHLAGRLDRLVGTVVTALAVGDDGGDEDAGVVGGCVGHPANL
jgi:hypothetical protein